MSVSELSSTQTWPRGAPPKILSDYRQRNKIQAALANLRLYSNQNNEDKVQELADSLYGVLTGAGMDAADHMSSSHFASRPIGVIREEPHFESMILCSEPDTNRSRVSSITYVDGIQGDEKVEQFEEPVLKKNPLWLRAIPYSLLFSAAIIYIGAGAEIFRMLDPEIGKLPYHTAVLLPFQICFTIGWGNIACTTAASQFFCVVYALPGIPLTFAAIANLGRLFVEAYCADWIFLTAVVRAKPGVKEKKRHMPISGAINLLIGHQFIGILLYNGLLDNLGIIRSMYFNIVAIALVGFGDISPQPKNLFESLVTMSYITVGAVILSAVLVSTCYHIQRVYFVLLTEKLNNFYERRQNPQQERKLSNGSDTNKGDDKV